MQHVNWESRNKAATVISRNLMALALSILAASALPGCPGAPIDAGGDDGGDVIPDDSDDGSGDGEPIDDSVADGDDQSDGVGGEVEGFDSGGFDDQTGLMLDVGSVRLIVPTDAGPSQTTLSMRLLTEEERLAGGLPTDAGFEIGFELGPAGTTFQNPVQLIVQLATPTELDTLAVLRFDEASGTFGGSDIVAVVSEEGSTATAELNGFSRYDFWNPPLPQGNVPIEEGEIVAGPGTYQGQPFSVFPGYMNTSASLTYSPYGNVFGLSLINVDLENPMTGDLITLTAGLHSTEVRRLDAGAILGLVTPAGGLSGPSFYTDGTPVFNKPVVGVMFLRKSETQWIVDVYCHYEGGLIFGQATGDL